MQEKDIRKIEKKYNICINVFSHENGLVFPIWRLMNLRLLTDDDKSHYVYIKYFDRFMFHKTKDKNKKYFCRSCLQCFSSKNVLAKHKEDCLSINGKQSVKVEEETIDFENYFKQIPFLLRIYADFECNLEGVESYEDSYSKNIKITVLVALPI